MSTIATVARVLLGLVFVVAAATKIGNGRDWLRQATASGTPLAVARPLPWVELALGATLTAGLWPPWPAVAAIGLLAGFTVWIIVHLTAGEHPPCACFGAMSTMPLSWRHAARNVALIALGVIALFA